MKVLLDTNVILDVLLKRQKWLPDSLEIWKAHDEGKVTAYVSATTLTDVFYLARQATDISTALNGVKICLQELNVATVDLQILQSATQMEGSDFEDNVQIACAQNLNIDVIVTRDEKGFKNSSIPSQTPNQFVAKLK
jgi:predicted nucleic acid-binding protein